MLLPQLGPLWTFWFRCHLLAQDRILQVSRCCEGGAEFIVLLRYELFKIHMMIIWVI